jgi:(2Fe-2S) ferredoxin
MTPAKKIVVCVNHRTNPNQPSCAARGSEAIACALEEALAQHPLDITLERFICLGRCEAGPNIRLTPAGPWYHELTLQDIPMLMAEIENFCKR